MSSISSKFTNKVVTTFISEKMDNYLFEFKNDSTQTKKVVCQLVTLIHIYIYIRYIYNIYKLVNFSINLK